MQVVLDPQSVLCRVVVPQLPPSTNTYVRHLRNGTHYKTAEAKQFQAAVRYAVWREERSKNIDWTKHQDKLLRAWIIVHSPKWITKKNTIRKKDLDNTAKVLLDSWQMATGIGDERVFEIVMFKRLAKDSSTELIIEDMGVLNV